MTYTIDQIKNHPAVADFATWEKSGKNRTYLTLSGYDRGYAGDRNNKVYIDNTTGRLIHERGKGTTSRTYQDSLNAIREAYVVVEMRS